MIRILFAALAAVGLWLAAPAAATPGQCMNTPLGGYCDSYPAKDGSFQHCETGPSILGFSYSNCYQGCLDGGGRLYPTD